MSDQANSTKWARPAEGRQMSGVCALLAARFGLPVGVMRTAAVLAALVGICVAILFSIFDYAAFGEPVGDGLRMTMIALGLFGFFGYPLLALVIPDGHSPRRWDFGSSAGAVLAWVLIGQAVGFLLAPYWQAAKAGWVARGITGLFTWFGDYHEAVGFGLKDGVLLLFFASGLAYVVLQRTALRRFFRSVHTGVVLVSSSLVAVALGVLVPQIDGFEDPDSRVNMEAEYADFLLFQEKGYQKLPKSLTDGHQQYQAFRWAEGYFLYHLVRPYGIGMPEAAIPPRVEKSLDRFGLRYGLEEKENRMKQMRASFSGREKVDEIGQFINAHEGTFWRFFQVSTALDLNRTYKSHWFASLLTLLGISIFFNTFKNSPRTWFKIQKLGYFTVHMGMLVLLCGGLTSKLFTDRGILHLWLDRGPEDVYWRHYDPKKKARLPFAVQLDEFARKDWMALSVLFRNEDFQSRPPSYTVWEGRQVDLDLVKDEEGGFRPRLRLAVREVYDRVNLGAPKIRESGPADEGGVPVARVVVHDAHLMGEHEHEEGETHERDAFLFPLDLGGSRPYQDPYGAYRLGVAFGETPAEHFPVEPDVLGRLHIENLDSGEQQSATIKLGETVTTDAGYTLRVVDATSDFGVGRDTEVASKHELPLDEQPYRVAAVWLDITPPDGRPTERRLLFEPIDDREHGRQAEHDYPDLLLHLRWDIWSAPGAPRFLLHWNEEQGPSLLSEAGERSEVVLGEPLDLPGADLNPVLPQQFVSRAQFEEDLHFLEPEDRADGWDADFYARTPRGLVLDVIRDPDTPQESVETVRLATANEANRESHIYFSPDNEFDIVFYENSEMMPFEWRSVLTIWEKDNSGNPYQVPLGTEKDREIRVNDYFKYKGYRFFQTNAVPEDPNYSGIGVVYDPGIELVLVGMYMIIGGTLIAFIIRPIVLGRRNARAKA